MFQVLNAGASSIAQYIVICFHIVIHCLLNVTGLNKFLLALALWVLGKSYLVIVEHREAYHLLFV